MMWTEGEVIQWEHDGKIPKLAMDKDRTLHFCPDWDFMLINKENHEYDACLCDVD